MNTTISERLANETTLVKNINEREAGLYKGALRLLASIVSDDFTDLPEFPRGVNRPTNEGLCYSIPFLDSSMLYSSNNSRDLIVIWKTTSGVSECPLRIGIKFNENDDYAIQVHDQSGQRTVTRDLFARNNSGKTTEFKNFDTITLSDLVKTRLV